jgi:hypothetical protein
MNLQIITINNNNYVLADDILKKAPVYSKGCRCSRDLFRRKEISDYIFAKLTDNGWELTDGKSAKFDKVLIDKKIINNIPELNINNTE